MTRVNMAKILKINKKIKIIIKIKIGRGAFSSLFSLSDLQHTVTVGTVFLATTISPPSSSPATDHLLQQFPPTALPTPHLQPRKQQQKKTKNPPPPLAGGLRGQKGLRPLQPTVSSIFNVF